MPEDHSYHAPPYDPHDNRRLGKGSDFGVELHALLVAGRVDFPMRATVYSQLTSTAHDLEQRIDFLRQSTGGEFALNLVNGLRQELQLALRLSASNIEHAGRVLEQIASDYATTDEEAHGKFADLLKDENGLPSPPVPVPPGSDSPYNTPYEPPSLDAPAPIDPFNPWLPPVEGDPDLPRPPGDGPGLDDEGPLQEDVPTAPTPDDDPTKDEYLPPLPGLGGGFLEEDRDEPVPDPADEEPWLKKFQDELGGGR